jgi:hypothetical protein
MKTIVHIELSDEERRAIGLGNLVTRKQVTELVNNFIQEKIRGETTEARTETESTDHGDPGQRRERGGDKRLPHDMPANGFSPSRGDEDYLTQPRDKDIAAACRSIIDATTLINEFAWETIERNRKK